MQNKELVSIVVPVYNVAPYLEQCVDSLLAQTYQQLEVILVDDGSTDESGVICDRYGAADSRVKVVHRENGGLATARNSGMPEVTGKYVYFMDSDDYLDLDAIEVMYRLAQEHECDILFAGFYSNDERKRPQETGEFSVVERDEALLMYLNDGGDGVIYPSACGKLICVEKLKDQLYFDASLLVAEDMEFTARTLVSAGKLGQLDRALYHYRYRSDSLNHRVTTRSLSVIDSHNAVRANFKKNAPEFIPMLEQHACRAYYYQLANAVLGGNTDGSILRPFVKELRARKKIVFSEDMPFKRRMFIKLMLTGTPICQLMAWLCGLRKKN